MREENTGSGAHKYQPTAEERERLGDEYWDAILDLQEKGLIVRVGTTWKSTPLGRAVASLEINVGEGNDE